MLFCFLACMLYDPPSPGPCYDVTVPAAAGPYLPEDIACSAVYFVLRVGSVPRGINAFTRVGTLRVATIYLQLIQNRYMSRSFTVLQCSHQHCVQPVASDVEVVGYL